MDARDLLRSVRMAGSANGWRSARSAWRRPRGRGGGREGEPMPGGGTVRFARSSLRVRVAVGGAVFCGWDGAGPEPSYALADGCPAAAGGAVIEPDKDGWRVVSERVTVLVSRHGAVE